MKKWFLTVLVLLFVSLMPLQAQTQPPVGTPPPSPGGSSSSSGQYSNSTITFTGGIIEIPGQQTPYMSVPSSGYGGNNPGGANFKLSGTVTPHWKWNSTTLPQPAKLLVIYDINTSYSLSKMNGSPVMGTGNCSDGLSDSGRWYQMSNGDKVSGRSHYREYKIVTTADLPPSAPGADTQKLPSVSPSANVTNGNSEASCMVWIKVTAVPAYESGTNCNFTFIKPVGVADLPSETELKGFSVKLGTEVVACNGIDSNGASMCGNPATNSTTQPNLITWTTPSGTPRTVRYMSNHFLDGAEIPLEVSYSVSFKAGTKADGTDNIVKQVFKEIPKKIVYNKYSSRHVKQFEEGVKYKLPSGPPVRHHGFAISSKINTLLLGDSVKHHEQGASIGVAPWDLIGNTSILNNPNPLIVDPNCDYGQATVVHISSHGLPDMYFPDIYSNIAVYDPTYDAQTLQRLTSENLPNPVRSLPVGRLRNLRTASGIPITNIVYASACATAADTKLAVAFGCCTPSGGSNNDGRAYCGYDRVSLIYGMQKGALAFWTGLSKGETITSVTRKVNDAYEKGRQDQVQWLKDNNVTINAMTYGTTVFKIYGDPKSSLSIVYDWKETDPSTWYKFP
jgi:hypothetical protein